MEKDSQRPLLASAPPHDDKTIKECEYVCTCGLTHIEVCLPLSLFNVETESLTEPEVLCFG